MRKDIESAEERLKTQVLYENKKRALKKLYQNVNKDHESFPQFKRDINSFFNSFETEYLPNELKGEIRSEIIKLEKFMEPNGFAPSSPPKEVIEKWMREYQEDLKELPDYEKAERELKTKFSSIKNSIRNSIKEEVKP